MPTWVSSWSLMFSSNDNIRAACKDAKADLAPLANGDKCCVSHPDTLKGRMVEIADVCALFDICRLLRQSSDVAARYPQVGQISIGEYREFIIGFSENLTMCERATHLFAFLMKECAQSIRNDL